MVLSFARVSWTLLWLASTQSTFLKFFRCSRFSEVDSKYLTKLSKWKKFVVYFWLRSHGKGQNFRPVENFVRFGVAFTQNHLAVRKFRRLRHLKFRVNRAKILNRPVWTKGQVRFFDSSEKSSCDVWTYPHTMKWMLRALWLHVNYDLIGYSRHTDGEVDFFLRQQYCLPWFVIYSVYSTNRFNVAVRLFTSQIDFYPTKRVL